MGSKSFMGKEKVRREKRERPPRKKSGVFKRKKSINEGRSRDNKQQHNRTYLDFSRDMLADCRQINKFISSGAVFLVTAQKPPRRINTDRFIADIIESKGPFCYDL